MPTRPSLLALALLLGVAGAPRSATPQETSGSGWTWTVAPAPDLSSLSVRLCFQGFRPRTLELPLGAGRGALRPRPATPGMARLVASGDAWTLEEAAGAPAPCLEYDVDVAALVRAGMAERIGGDLLTQPGAWLLTPARFTVAEVARVEFALPQGLSASVPWSPLPDGGHEVPSTAFAFESRVAFGRFVPRRLEVAGVPFVVAVLDGPRRASEAGVDAWIRAAGEAVGALYGGRFPVDYVQILVEPSRPSREPVIFGRAFQSGGSGVILYLSATAEDAELPLEWIAVHELTHLGLPGISPEDAWLHEGFVTYYQEVLRARAGLYGEDGPWRELERGFARGRRKPSDRSIAEDSRTMHAQHAYHRVYWAGAALALRVDLALRAETGGRRSLDDAMRHWATIEVRARGGWRALDLLAEADRALGTRACVASVRGPLASSDFPATDDLYEALGVKRVGESAAAVSNEPAQVALRSAIGRAGIGRAPAKPRR